MTTLWHPFDRPQPLASCLMHEAVLVQAWKKAHAYIRSHNSYADVLELDLSAINLKTEIARWRSEYAEQGPKALLPQPMRLVPAPKTCRWTFDASGGKKRHWRPVAEESGRGKTWPCLRPLAHLSIRDQTLATATMICLADVVETAQGDCRLPTTEARDNHVSSYGNRLLCDWRRTRSRGASSRASFAWGNASSYRKYFDDYRRFLTRGRDVCADVQRHVGFTGDLGIVSLDLSAFYDRIAPSAVIAALKDLCRKHGVPSDDVFWTCLTHIFKWTWAEDDIPADKLLRVKTLPKGLPQGLVASGFFANAYMLEFDAAIRKATKAETTLASCAILDYCRYVDDMRLVVRSDPLGSLTQHSGADVKADCNRFVQKLLGEHAKGQECNPKKSEYTSYRVIQAKSSRAATMELIQHHMSGPMDIEALEEASVALEGMLLSVEHEENAATATLANAKVKSELAHVAEMANDIRDDTLKRFTANRLFRALRERRVQVASDVGTDVKLERQKLDAEIETTARRLIRLWAGDPSLCTVLRYAMRLMPCPKLLETVLAELQGWMTSRSRRQGDVVARWTCLYVAADLLRAGVVETGMGDTADSLPARSDIASYRQRLTRLARAVLRNRTFGNVPWYVTQQAMFVLLAQGFTGPTPPAAKKPVLQDYADLVHVAAGRFGSVMKPASRLVPLVLVAMQLCGFDRRLLRELCRWLSTHPSSEAANIGNQLVLADREVGRVFLSVARAEVPSAGWLALVDPGDAVRPTQQRPTDKSLPLMAVAGSPNNPFHQENAALHLLLAMIDHFRTTDGKLLRDGVSAYQVRIRCVGWEQLRDASVSNTLLGLGIEIVTDEEHRLDPRYQLPDWCPDERRWLMTLGRILKAAVTGDADYTSAAQPLGQSREGYRGLRTSWYKRQHGMLHRTDALGGSEASCSPWLPELLAKMLLWPGCREVNRMIKSWAKVRSLTDLRRLVIARLQGQARLYGHSSNLPIYVHPVGLKLKSPPMLTVVLIQTVRPWRRDFKDHGATLDRNGFTAIRRGHLAALLRLAEKQLAIRTTYNRKPQADLIILPEFAVHEDDIDLIKRAVDRTRAMVFCGLAFRNLPGTKQLVSGGRWVIPDETAYGRTILERDQGKHHLTRIEQSLGAQPWRPHQVIIQLDGGGKLKPYQIAGSMCYDATDLCLAADLRDKTDLFVVPSNNQDVTTFDTMVQALNYHMYQHVLIVNSGEFGGSAVMAPYEERHERVLTHHHGGGHAAVSIVDIDLGDYQRTLDHKDEQRQPQDKGRALKTAPAGYRRHRQQSKRVE